MGCGYAEQKEKWTVYDQMILMTLSLMGGRNRRMLSILALLILTTSMKPTNGVGYISYCDIRSEPMEYIGIDSESSESWILPNYHNNGTAPPPRSRRLMNEDEDISPLSPGISQNYPLNNHTWDHIIEARRCFCASQEAFPNKTFYCQAPLSHCGIPPFWINPDYEPGCVFLKTQRRFVRFIWLFLICFYMSVFAWLCGTRNGRTVVDFCMAKCFPNWNAGLVDDILRYDPDRANSLIYHFIQRNTYAQRQWRWQHRHLVAITTNDNPSEEEEIGFEVPLQSMHPTELQLKCQTYHANERQAEDDGREEHCCTICFNEFNEGDRVGKLNCQHLFHAQCLKTWLSRRNVCPLCQAPNAAMPCP